MVCKGNKTSLKGQVHLTTDERWQRFYLEEGEVPVALDLSDLQVAHDDLTAIVTVFIQIVLILLGACGAQSVLRTGTHR